MSYTALARRYRSQSFDSVVGQEPIAQTLKAAIASDRVHHAYLFCGTRGVGKTSMARLFARGLNAPDTIPDCPRPKGVEFPAKDVQQRMADAIMRGEDMNVIEIDAASNRGIDDARQLATNAGLAPSGNARFKVYIIDEVHMLTREASNSLLKLMEEPPSHVKFILATTDPHKILPTILSRCQRFDFRNIPTAKIVEHLRDVCEQEGVKADDGVLYQVASLGAGSMRDALSLLDRLMASDENPLTGELIQRMLGLPDRELVFKLVDAVADSDAAAVLGAADELINRGIAQDQMLSTLVEHYRCLMIAAAAGADSPLIEVDDASRKRFAAQSGRFDTASLVHTIALLENVQRHSRISATPRALLDASLLRLAMSEKVADLAALLGGPGTGGVGGEKKKLATPSPDVEVRRIVLSDDVTLRSVGASIAPPASANPPQIKPQDAKPAAAAPRPDARPQAAPAPARRAALSQKDRDAMMNLELVKQVVDLFDARVVDMQKAATPGSTPGSTLDPTPDPTDDESSE